MMLRNAIYDIKFKLQKGVHAGHGNDVPDMSVEEALDELSDRLGITRISVKPFYTVNWDDSEVGYPYIMSHLSGRKYPIREAIVVDLGDYTVSVTDEEAAKNNVGKYERDRDIIK